MNKESLRLNIKTRKSVLSDSERLAAAQAAFARLEESVAFIMADHILIYHSLPDELSTLEFLDKWHQKKHFYLPRVNGVNLDLLPYDRHHLHLGAFHIEEPTGSDTVDISGIELIIVPSVAFDRNGNRLGRGKGFYDRLLATTSATKIGVGYDFQLVDEIETEPHDIPLDIIITD
ncbi:MAG: 5-formyltetrahydrofolate cyclo-ligase, partial [Muribaculaceae bacterium]|nr:5-formyltetrahydrofolate cyclo-ligase [Muribaculaceae bacterium]